MTLSGAFDFPIYQPPSATTSAALPQAGASKVWTLAAGAGAGAEVAGGYA